MKKLILFTFCASLFLSCKEADQQSQDIVSQKKGVLPEVSVTYAQGFSIQRTALGYNLTVKNPWPDAQEIMRYNIVVNKPEAAQSKTNVTTIVAPVKTIILTSTTHIPPVALLQEIETITGFPGTDYISNLQVRKRIDAGAIVELGKNQQLAIEQVLRMEPEVIMGYGINGDNPIYKQLSLAGLPVLYNGDWIEPHPLGKAEWIKVFGLLYDKVEEANRIFKEIEYAYLKTKKLAAGLSPTTVLTGATWKDIWYLPYGDSWQAQLLADAAGDYVYSNTKGKGSLSYNIEQVLKDAQHAHVWIAPGQYTSYQAMKADQPAYALFDAFKSQNIYSFVLTKGAKGGVTYYEEASIRPDIVLKDLVTILHPEADLAHELYFFKPLTQ